MQVASLLLVVLPVFAVIALKLFNSLRTMQVQMGIGVVLSRYESPVLFWLLIALQSLALGVLFAITYAVYVLLPGQIMS
jgi:hypothetical protein